MLITLFSLAMADPCATHQDGQLILESKIQFAPSTTDLVDSQSAIDSILCAIRRDPTMTLQIEAHTDSRGSGSYNLRVSQGRADAIRAALIAAGVAAERVTAVGYGESHPISDNMTAAGRGQNQRIEFHTEAPESRRPRPAGAVQPPAEAVPPPPVVDRWCADLSTAIGQGRAARWERPGELSVVAQRTQQCLNGSWTSTRDGEALYSTHPKWTLAVESTESGVVVRLDPQVP